MRVAVITAPTDCATGALRMAWHTAASLQRRGHEAVLLTGSAPPATVASSLPVRVVTESASIPEALGELAWRPDVVHTFDLVEPAWALAAQSSADRLGHATVITPATDIALWEARHDGLRACRAADVVLALTHTERRTLVAGGVPRSHLALVGQGADIPVGGDGHRFRTRHAIVGPIVLFLGRMVRFKGYTNLLAAAPLVWAERPDVTFVYAGPSVDVDRHEQFAAAADPRALDLGELSAEDKADALAACDVLCLPSSADVFPLVFVEAWLSGAAVVTGDFLGATDVVRHGVDGMVTPARPDAVAATLLEVLTGDTAARLGRAGRERAVEDFTWEAVAAKHEAVYLRALTDRRRRSFLAHPS